MYRHIIFILYVLLSVSFIYAAETINIPLDPISHNEFYINSIYPSFQPDFIEDEYIIDGNIGYAMSVYNIRDLYSNINDSVRTNSSFLYKQGDVGYRDFTFDIKTKVNNTGILKLIGNGVSYPGRISQYSSGNILQNYLLHFSKKFNYSTLSFYTAYHLENKNLNYINSNSGESYFSGINYSLTKEKYQINFRYAFQIGQTNFLEPKDYHINWGIFKGKYFLNELFTPYITNFYKDLYFDGNIYTINDFSSGIIIDFSFISFNIAANTIIGPELIIETKFDNLNINAGHSGESWFSVENKSIDSYRYFFSRLSYESDNINISFEPRHIYDNTGRYNSPYFGLNSIFNTNFHIIRSKTQIIPVLLSLYKTKSLFSVIFNHYQSNDFIIKNHISSSLKFFEVSSEKRYRKFFGIEYDGIQFNNPTNLEGVNSYTYYNDNNLKNYLDFYIGLEFDKFIFSWHFTNVLSEDYLISSNQYIENHFMKYFMVKWKFDN